MSSKMNNSYSIELMTLNEFIVTHMLQLNLCFTMIDFMFCSSSSLYVIFLGPCTLFYKPKNKLHYRNLSVYDWVEESITEAYSMGLDEA